MHEPLVPTQSDTRRKVPPNGSFEACKPHERSPLTIDHSLTEVKVWLRNDHWPLNCKDADKD